MQAPSNGTKTHPLTKPGHALEQRARLRRRLRRAVVSMSVGLT